MKASVYIEFYGEQVSQDYLVGDVQKIWENDGKKLEDLKTISLYIQPEQDMVYYVVNGDVAGSFHIINTQNDF